MTDLHRKRYELGELERDAEHMAQFTRHGGWFYRFFMWIARHAREAREDVEAEIREQRRAP